MVIEFHNYYIMGRYAMDVSLIDMMIQHRLEGICSVYYTVSSNLGMSLELPSAMSTIFYAQHVFTTTHVDVRMNLTRRR